MLRGKRIVILSPQRWGTMRISKHHYAVALAQRGNQVFFVEPPDEALGEDVVLEALPDAPGLTRVRWRSRIPMVLRFHLRRAYDALLALELRRLARRIGSVDLVWCFDTNLYASVRPFGARGLVYHVVDDVAGPTALRLAREADLVVSVAPQILDRFAQVPTPRLHVSHGVAPDFTALAEERLAGEGPRAPGPLRVGYVGNLLIASVDRVTLRALVASHPNVEFHMWGACDLKTSNFPGDASAEANAFVEALRSAPNVHLHGPTPTAQLAQGLRGMDALLVCYDGRKDTNAGWNSHKLLEYFCTGRVVVGNRIAAWADRPDLVQMATRPDNSDLPDLFRGALDGLESLNGEPYREARLRAALSNAYARHVETIEAALARGAGAERPRRRTLDTDASRGVENPGPSS